MLYTCTCILAVDFPAFPRRYAKAETYGSGLMDVGVGGIILAMGLVSSRCTAYVGSKLFFTRLLKGLRVSIPCLVLGGARFASVKLLGYQVGIHTS